jgi:hypothetical protein
MRSLSDSCAPAYTPKLQNLSYTPYIASERGFVACLSRGAQRPRRVRGGAAALNLDTRILEGNLNHSHRPSHVSYSDKAYSGRPINYPIYDQAHNFRAKIQEFSGGGFEVVITSINMQRHADLAAMHLPRGPRTERKGDHESIEKARRRAKRMVRLKCKEMGADHLITFTTRQMKNTRDELKAAWAKFTDNVSYHMGRKFEYVCVCEPHPTNPEHLHLHAAIRGRLTAREMVIFRRCWYIALGGTGKERGADTPGGFRIDHIRVKGGAMRRMDKIAGYLSKYITKTDSAEFNKKRYWASKIDLKEARAYWLKARTIGDALAEFVKDFDFMPSDLKQDFFQARNIDLVWMRCCPDPENPPPVPF